MQTKTVKLGNCEFDVLSDQNQYVGVGAIRIGDTIVRSGRLPMRVFTQSFSGLELAGQRLLGIDTNASEIRIRTEASFHALPVKLMRDHSFDPIHEMGDWDQPHIAGTARLDLVIRPAHETFDGIVCNGFSYHYDYNSKDVGIFYLMDMASWELDGNIQGATVVSQSSCSEPMVELTADNGFSTEGIIHWEDTSGKNPVMTHNLPRWASHQAFDFQFKGAKALLGVFERVELIRSVLQRDKGKAELKTFDKHIFDQATSYKTVAKKILLNADRKSATAHKNLWTRVFDQVHDAARAEYGLAEEPLVTRLAQNFWATFNYDSYYRDLIPATAALGVESIFIDNVNKSAMTEQGPMPGVWNWNMCCGHEYEPAPRLGGPKKLKQLMDSCNEFGIQVFSWTNNDQALSSPLNRHERDDGSGWYVLLEDTRQKWGGAYMGCMSALNFRNDAPRNYWVDALKKIKEETGLSGYLFDSFYNLGFFPVSYDKCAPSTQWKQLLQAFKQLQDAGVHFLIESFGPFGSPAHGCPASYGDKKNIFSAYKLSVNLGYTTVPSGGEIKIVSEASTLYYYLAHMVNPGIPLHIEGKRIDKVWGDDHKRALADYRKNRSKMHKRFLQEDGQSVLWHDKGGRVATLWNFADRQAALAGEVMDVTTGKALPKSSSYALVAQHTYSIAGAELPTTVG